MNTIQEKYTHRHIERATRAHYNVSHYPERGGRLMCEDLDHSLDAMKEAGASEDQLKRAENLWLAWVDAKARCISSFITGGSNFPVRRAEKANQSEHNRLTDYMDYVKKVVGKLKQERYYEEHPEARPISMDDSDAGERLRQKLASLEKEQEMMKAANKLIRKGDVFGLVDLVGKKLAQILLSGDVMGDTGFPSYQLTNNNANIRRVREQIAQLDQVKGLNRQEIDLPGDVKAVLDPEAVRVYFEFPGKPDDKTRELLKRNGFKWTPSQGHWGRKLTANASAVASRLIAEFKKGE